MTGFVAVYREATSHPLFKGHADRLGAWMWLLMSAAWKPTQFDVSGKIVTLQRGQLSVSVRHLGEAWGWPKSNVDRFLTRLKTETMIETDSGTGRLIITICNYDKYQDVSERSGTLSGTQVGTAAGQQRDIKEQGNKETRDIEPNGSISQRASARSFPKPDDVDQSVWEDFCAHRKRKKANITETAMRAIAKQAGVAGWSLNDALIESVSRGWIGFKAEWVRGNGNGTNYNQSSGGPVDPMVQAHLAREARRAGQQQAFFGDDADSWAEVGAGASGVF